MNTPAQTVAQLAAIMTAKEQEVLGYRAIIADVSRFSNEANQYKEACNNAINNMSIIRQEAKEDIERERELRLDVEASNTDLTARLKAVEDDKEDLNTSVALLRGQKSGLEEQVSSLEGELKSVQGQVTSLKGDVMSLEEQATSLRAEITRKEADWSMENVTQAAAKAEVDDHLAAQRKMRLEIEEERDQLKDEVIKLASNLQASEKEKDALAEKLKIAQGKSS